MNIVNQKREEIIRNENTAQQQFLDILEKCSRQSRTLNIPCLSGDIDMAPLREEGFGLVDKILFAKGKITSIQNIPNGISSLICTGNLLVSLENLPSSLTYINVSENVIDNINISNLNKLETLILSDNKIKSLENLPTSLTELVCDSNQLQQLNLIHLVNLKMINLSNNKLTLIENLPKAAKILFDNNPGIEFRDSEISGGDTNDKPNDTNYKDALNEYFRLKSEYETKIHIKKKNIYKGEPNKKIAKRLIQKYIPDCIKCKRKVGTVFNKSDNVYKAICGDTQNPCNLDIQIFPGTLLGFQNVFELVKEEFDSVRDTIIRQKLDELFNYVSAEEADKLYKKQNELYIESSESYTEQLEKYNEMYNNVDTQQRIQEKRDNIFSLIEKNKALIDEYKKSNNVEFLKAGVDLQISEIYPEVRNLRMLQHEIMEIESSDNGAGMMFPLNTLFQQNVSLSKLDFSSGEQQRVISFTV